MAGTHTKLKGIDHFSKETLTNQIEKNIIDYFNYALLEVGAFYTVHAPQSGLYGGRNTNLRLVDDPNYTKGRVWEGYRNDWVWETGIDYRTQPIRVSGVTVNGTFHPTSGTGSFSHIVDYPQGRIIFNSAISSTATVQCSFSHRAVTFTNTDAPWFREIQKDTFRVDDATFSQFGSGNWNQLSLNRVNLPAVAVDSIIRPDAPGLELGGGQKIKHIIGFYVIAQNAADRNKIADCIAYQKEKDIFLYDINAVPQHRQPLNSAGSPALSGYSYPEMVAPSSDGGFRWRFARFESAQIKRMQTFNPKLYAAEVFVTLEVAMHNL